MSGRIMWVIIVLMSLALVGSILLQGYWINERLTLTEKQFDDSIFAALNAVSEKIEKDEKKNLSRAVFQPGKIAETSLIGGGGDFFPNDLDYGVGLNSRRYKYSDSLQLSDEFEKYDTYNKRISQWRTEELYSPSPVQERINIDRLDTYLKQEIRSHGIDLEFNYGVFSPKEEDFVIRDGFFTYVSSEAPMSQPELDNSPKENGMLLRSKYSVPLFKSEVTILPAGWLMMHFPGRTGYVWGSVWTAFLLSFLFTGIILFCFIYTTRVIFTQKKLSMMKSDFINNMTHEFKTPIATISLATDSITNPMISGNPEKVQRFANIIKQENRRMNKQVEKVLQMALLDKQDFQLKITRVDVHEVIKQAVNNVNLRVEKKGGKASANLNAANYFIEADLTHFSNVINNLLDNAYKYSPESPEIVVTTENVTSGVRINVRDNGIGMDKDALKHIFDKFYRVHTGNLHDVKGFGLGLSYVKAIVTAHKGQVHVASELGEGSEFTLIFPYIVES